MHLNVIIGQLFTIIRTFVSFEDTLNPVHSFLSVRLYFVLTGRVHLSGYLVEQPDDDFDMNSDSSESEGTAAQVDLSECLCVHAFRDSIVLIPPPPIGDDLRGAA